MGNATSGHSGTRHGAGSKKTLPAKGARVDKAASTRRAKPAKPAQTREGSRAVLLRLTAAEEAYLEEVVASQRERAQYFRYLLERDMARRRRRARAAMFAAAAGDIDEQERAERKALIGGFSNRK